MRANSVLPLDKIIPGIEIVIITNATNRRIDAFRSRPASGLEKNGVFIFLEFTSKIKHSRTEVKFF
jgi:hypothetical protein